MNTKKTHEGAYEIIHAIVVESGRYDPGNRTALIQWVMATFNVARNTASDYVKRAGKVRLKISGQDAKTLVSDMVARLDAIIYSPNSSDKSVIEATKVKANLLGVWRVSIQTTSAAFEPMTEKELIEQIDADSTSAKG